MSRLRLRANVIWHEADGEVIAVDGDLRNYASTNQAGSLLWKALADGASREDLAMRLVDEFGIDAGRAAGDAGAFVADLEANGFLEA